MLGGATQLCKRREIQALSLHLKSLMNPADDSSFLAACNIPKMGLGSKSQVLIQKLSQQRGTCCYEWLVLFLFCYSYFINKLELYCLLSVFSVVNFVHQVSSPS